MNLADYTFRKQIGLHHSRASAIDNSHTHNSARSAHTNSAVGRKSLNVQMIKTEDISPPPWGLSPLGNEVLGVIIRQDNIEQRRLLHSFILKSLYRINTREEWRMSALLDCTTFISFFPFFRPCTTGSVGCTFPTSVKKQQTNGQRQLISDISAWTSVAKCWCSGEEKKIKSIIQGQADLMLTRWWRRTSRGVGSSGGPSQ